MVDLTAYQRVRSPRNEEEVPEVVHQQQHLLNLSNAPRPCQAACASENLEGKVCFHHAPSTHSAMPLLAMPLLPFWLCPSSLHSPLPASPQNVVRITGRGRMRSFIQVALELLEEKGFPDIEFAAMGRCGWVGTEAA